MSKPPKKARGRNPQLGNSLISLGPHGGINYKFKGTKDSYGLHKKRTNKVYSSNNREEWQKYNQTIEEHKREKEREAKLRSYKHYVKKAGTKRKYNLWPDVIIDVFYYHKKNTISKYDLFLLKEAHYCNSKKCIVTKINNGKVSIRCNKCKARNRIPYTKFISLYNNANKLSYEV